jgi:hypothetical protein
MHRFLSSLLRPFLWSSIAVVVTAVGLGRIAPRPFPSRHQAVPRYHGVNGRYFAENESMPRFLDRQTGEILRVDFPKAETLEYASCSPWRDDRGQYQLVCRWMERSGEGSDNLPREFGIARFSLPEGRMIDRVALEELPIGEPCWIPGLAPRILFVSGNGQIYRYAFEDATGRPDAEAEAFGPSRPRRLIWRTTPPGLGLVYFKDLIWPSDPRLGGRMIASLSYQVCVEGTMEYVGPQLWWIALNGDATAIEAAGRLTDSDHGRPSGLRDPEERLPNVSTTPSGELALAYLSRDRNEPLWDLRMASVATDPATGNPGIRRDGSHVLLTGQCVPSGPAFSADGRWVYGIVGLEFGYSSITTRRFSVAGALTQTIAAGSGSGWDGGSRLARPGGGDLAGFVTSRLVDGPARYHARR